MSTKKLEFNTGIIGRRIERTPIDQLRLYAANVRTHPEKQIELLKWSIKRFGFMNPVLIDRDNLVIAGHGRIEAAQQLGHTSVPAVTVDLDERAKRSFRLVDNKAVELAGWDEVLLALELQDLSDGD